MLQRFFNCDVTNLVLRDLNNNAIADGTIRVARGDKFMICGTAKRWNGAAWGDYTIAATSAITVILKLGRHAYDSGVTLPNGTTASTSLAFSDADQANISGDWAEATPGTAKFSIRMDLTGAALLALIDANIQAGGVTCLLELTETDISGNQSSLGQASVRILWDAYRGVEIPTEGAPVAYTQAEVLALLNDRIVVAGGKRIRVNADGNYFSEDV
jgi:hypothetical protein